MPGCPPPTEAVLFLVLGYMNERGMSKPLLLAGEYPVVFALVALPAILQLALRFRCEAMNEAPLGYLSHAVRWDIRWSCTVLTRPGVVATVLHLDTDVA